MGPLLSHPVCRTLALVIGLMAVLGTTPARAGDECDDGDVCNGLETKERGDCKSGKPLDCDDEDPCTEDQCEAKDALYTPLPEVCDDCADNDGDGLADYEDPDCCIQETTLDIGRLWLKPTTTSAGSRLRLKANMRMSMGPMHDVTLQITDGSGQLLCRTIPAESWRKGRAIAFRFRDKGSRHADGLRAARLKVRRDGRLVFRARGKKMPLRFTPGGPARITVRMGQQCASVSGELCPHRNALLFFPPVP